MRSRPLRDRSRGGGRWLRAAAACLAAAAAPAAAAAELPPPVHQTRLVVSYDAARHTVRGREHLRWHNTSRAPVPELRFHLYLNAFANNRSTFLRESGVHRRDLRTDDRRWGWIEVTSVRLADGTELAGRAAFVAPDDGNPDDRTVVRYPLPEPLPPGGWVELDLEFTARLPDPFARTGVHGDYVLAGQWYPHIAVFEDAGVRGRATAGWNAHQFHADSEFYADFGDYDVTLTLPAEYRGRIGATGTRVGEPEVADGTVTVRFVQRGVHDFAWAADPDFRVVRARFDPERDVDPAWRRSIAAELGLPAAALRLEPVDLTLLLQPDHAGQADRYLGAAKAALRGYGTRLGAYPYGTLTMVDPPLGGLGSGGMEYPTFITLGTHALLDLPPFRGVLFPELVTVHELGHQYFQGMSASNEFEEAWLDEGINTYYESVVMTETYGRDEVRLLGVGVPYLEALRAGGLGRGRLRDPVVAPAWSYLSPRSYVLNSYDRPALVLHQLRRLIGARAFDRGLRAFFRGARFHHPATADFESALNAAAGTDLSWFFDQALHSTRTLSYAVAELSSRRLPPEEGVVWRDGERRTVGGDDAAGPWWRRRGAGDDDRPWLSTAVVTREGDFVHPVTVELRFSDDRVVRRRWDGRARWARWRFRGPARLVSAEVDPDGVMVLDVDRLDNSRTESFAAAPVAAFLADLGFWMQALLTAAGVLA